MLMARKVAIVGGFDTSGGAGLAADMRTAIALRCAPMAVATSLAIQSDFAFIQLSPVDRDSFEKRLAQTLSQAAAIKIGALGSAAHLRTLSEMIQRTASTIPRVFDPVLQSTSGGGLTGMKSREIRRMMFDKFFPRLTLITPNIPEAQFLLGDPSSKPSTENLAQRLYEKSGCGVYLKGGHESLDVHVRHPVRRDFFFTKGISSEIAFPLLRKGPVRGTGCCLATAFACFLAQGYQNSEELLRAIFGARRFLQDQISRSKKVSGGVFHIQ